MLCQPWPGRDRLGVDDGEGEREEQLAPVLSTLRCEPWPAPFDKPRSGPDPHAVPQDPGWQGRHPRPHKSDGKEGCPWLGRSLAEPGLGMEEQGIWKTQGKNEIHYKQMPVLVSNFRL